MIFIKATSKSFLQYYRDNNNIIIVVFRTNIKKITGKTGNDDTKEVEITVPLKYLSKFWTALEITLFNCEINLILTLSANCFLAFGNVANQLSMFTIPDAKLYVPVITLSTELNAKLFKRLEPGCKNK